MEEQVADVSLGWPWVFAALGACALIVGVAVLRRRAIRPATFVWAAPFAGLAAFLAAWCAGGLCQTDPASFCECQLWCAVLGVAVLCRDVVTRGLEALLAWADAFGRAGEAGRPGGLGTAGRTDAAGDSGVLERMGRTAARAACWALPWVRDAVLLGAAAWLSFVALECADNADWELIDVALRDREVLVLGLALGCLYFLGQRRGALCVAVPVVCALLGLTQNFLDLFKNTALLPSDVLAWQTAASVSGGYVYVLPTLAIQSLLNAFAAIAALAFVTRVRPARANVEAGRPVAVSETGASAGKDDATKGKPSDGTSGAPNLATNGMGAETDNAHASRKSIQTTARRAGCAVLYVALACLCAVGAWRNVSQVDFEEDLGVELDFWDLRNSYRTYGFFSSFIAATQALEVAPPEGYSDEEAQRIQSELARLYDEQLAGAHAGAAAQFEQRRPSVIAIMNESYADLSIFDGLHVGYAGTFASTGLRGCAVKGDLAMSVHGGGTCNSEYEFLAFSSMGLMGAGMYPYQQFSFAGAPTLPAAFKQMGYGTWAMHPSYPGNWNREFVYADMGIDTSLFVYDFEGVPLFHGCVSDRATYDRALSIVREADGPQFVLDITMQNHGGYDQGNIAEGDLVKVRPDFLSDEQADQLDEYLSCVQSSDEALEYLIGQLSQMDEPVAVVFFGDHQPSLSRDYNDALFPDEAEAEHMARIAQTPYFVWTNYEVAQVAGAGGAGAAGAGAAGGTMQSSANYLGAQLLEAIGAPLSDYQKALLVLHELMPAVNTNGYCDPRGTWHAAADAWTEGESGNAIAGTFTDIGAGNPYHALQMVHYLNVVRAL